MNILDKIIADRKESVRRAKATTDVERLIAHSREKRSQMTPHRLRSSILAPGSSGIIGEFKRASPSKGIIDETRRPADVARFYEIGGACAMSVLTEEKYFQGSLDDLRQVRATVNIPLLRKDFVVDEFQIYEAAEAGADAILLIVSALPTNKLAEFQTVAGSLGLDALVEVHSADEMDVANEISAKLIGVNNRNLKTFDVSLDVSRELVQYAPDGVCLVSESGLRSRSDLEELSAIGYSGFLIGEALMKSEDPTDGLRQLTTR